MNLTPELIEAAGKAVVGVMAALGALVATIASTITAFFTWKNRYEIDKLYAHTLRANPDGTPGPMRRHPRTLVKLFCRRDPPLTDRAPTPVAEDDFDPPPLDQQGASMPPPIPRGPAPKTPLTVAMEAVKAKAGIIEPQPDSKEWPKAPPKEPS